VNDVVGPAGLPLPGGASVTPRPRTRGRTALPVFGGAARALASVGLFLVSRGKWSDAIIDSGLAGHPNPMRHKISIPGYLRESNEDEFLLDLRRARPEAIVIVRRPAGEYGRGLFGEEYGERTRDWIEKHYVHRPVSAAIARVYTIAGRPAL